MTVQIKPQSFLEISLCLLEEFRGLVLLLPGDKRILHRHQAAVAPIVVQGGGLVSVAMASSQCPIASAWSFILACSRPCKRGPSIGFQGVRILECAVGASELLFGRFRHGHQPPATIKLNLRFLLFAFRSARTSCVCTATAAAPHTCREEQGQHHSRSQRRHWPLDCPPAEAVWHGGVAPCCGFQLRGLRALRGVRVQAAVQQRRQPAADAPVAIPQRRRTRGLALKHRVDQPRRRGGASSRSKRMPASQQLISDNSQRIDIRRGPAVGTFFARSSRN